MRKRFVLIVFLLVSSNLTFAFDFSKLGFGSKKSTTPIEKVEEAMSDVTDTQFKDGVKLTSEDSIAFKGFTAIYVDGQFMYLTNSNMDGGDHIVIMPLKYSDGSGQRMYIKHDGKWSNANFKTVDKFVRGWLLRSIDTQLLVNPDNNEIPKALVMYGDTCGYSQRMERLLETQNIPHSIIPQKFTGSTNSNISLACSNAATWKEWSTGKSVTFHECNEKQDYDKFIEQFESVVYMIQNSIGYPYTVFPNGETHAGDPSGSKQATTTFLDQLNASQLKMQ